ncbi:MAG: hypothetical protein N3E46_01630, partial [Gemmataceae bacterium]|nr:hypothetical protein [Gemmataceae bacterium]
MKPVQQRGLRVYWVVCLLVFWGGERVWSAEGPQGGEGKLVVYPAEVKLTGRRAEQRLVVLGPAGAGGVRDWSREAQWQVENEQVAAVEGGVVRPRGDGQTVVRVRAGGQEAAVPVRVERYAADELVDFVREVEPILTKAGCNSGGCHGAALGRGGFRLSLFGFDPAFDYAQIVRSSEGRRVVVA